MDSQSLRNSISTSVYIKIFKNHKCAIMAHIFKSTLLQLQLSLFTNVNNFNPARLQKTAREAYPLHNRPRGNNDIDSVIYHQTRIQQREDIPPIWVVQQNNQYILLDGAHRIVASYIEDIPYINAYVIRL
jgi:hypothetical protein